MDTRAVDGGARRWKAVQVGGGVAVLAGVLFALPNLHRPPPPSTALHRADIHAEYVKFPSGRDTITAYLAYPERKDPAPAVVVIHEIFGIPDFMRRDSASTRRTTPASTRAGPTWTRRSGRTTRPSATPSIPASGTASCGPVKSRKSRTARGRRW